MKPAELDRALFLEEAKHPVESGHVVEARIVADDGDGLVSFDEKRAGSADAFFCEPLTESASDDAFESTGE